jgi:hypothetical protein
MQRKSRLSIVIIPNHHRFHHLHPTQAVNVGILPLQGTLSTDNRNLDSARKIC